MARLSAALRGNPAFALLTVSVDESAEDVKKLFAKHAGRLDALEVLMDPARKTPTAYGTEKFPETYLIDPSGKIIHRFINQRDWSGAAAAACVRAHLP